MGRRGSGEEKKSYEIGQGVKGKGRGEGMEAHLPAPRAMVWQVQKALSSNLLLFLLNGLN